MTTSIRLVTLLLGASFTLLITRQLISHFGISNYAVYIVFTSIPNLIPFADLGLGLGVFNVYAKQDSQKELVKEAKMKISLAFFLICIISAFGIGIFYLTFKTQIFSYFFVNSLTYLHDIKAFLIVCILFMSTPFTLGFRKMYANGNVLKATLMSFQIPLFNFILTISFLHFSETFNLWLVLVPSISYFLANFFAFLSADVFRDLELVPIKYIAQNSKFLFRFAMYATLFSSIVALVLHMPKFIFASFNQNLSVAKYSIFLIVISSIGSLFSTYASLFVPFYKRDRFNRDSKSYLVPTKKSLLYISVSALLSVLTVPSIIERFFGIKFSFPDFIVSVISGLIYLGWVFYNSFLSEIKDLKVLLLAGLGSSTVNTITLFFVGFRSYSIIMLVVWIQFFITLLAVSLFRVFIFRESENA